MTSPVPLKAGQLLLLVLAVFMIGMGTGALILGLGFHLRGYVLVAAPAEIVGLVAFIVLSIWKSIESWAERTGYTKPS